MSRQQGVLGRYVLELKEVPDYITAEDLGMMLQLMEDPYSTIVRISRLATSSLQVLLSLLIMRPNLTGLCN